MGILQQSLGTAQGAANDSFAWAKTATALSAAGDISSGVGGLQLFNYQAAVAAHNAQIMAQNAEATRAAGEYTAETLLERGGQIAGRARAGYGASNIDVNIGAPKQVEASTKAVSAMDAAIERYNAAREAYGLQVQGEAEKAQAKVDKSAGLGTFLQGISGAGSTLLGGASSISGKYAQWKLGMPPSPNSSPLGT